jgi:putative NADPH-quinone reductase
MKVLVVYDHPWDKSFNNAILMAVVKGLKEGGHEVDIVDLHREGFDPVFRPEELALYQEGKYLDPKVGEYQKRIGAARHLFFIFPVWWVSIPALLKGFFDKVFLPLWAWDPKGLFGLIPKGLLTHIEGATVINTMALPTILYRFSYHNPVKQVLIRGTLKFCGIKCVKWFRFGMVPTASPKKRERWLRTVSNYARRLK